MLVCLVPSRHTAITIVVDANRYVLLPLQSKLEAARAKAEAISGQEDLPMGSKMKEIQKLMAKAKASGKGNTKKKASRSDQYKKTKPMDRRMFSDKRAVNHKAKKKAAKKSKPKGRKNNGM